MSQPPGASPTSTPGTRPATAGVTVKVRTRDSFPLFEIFGERRHMAAFALRQRHPTASLGVLPCLLLAAYSTVRSFGAEWFLQRTEGPCRSSYTPRKRSQQAGAENLLKKREAKSRGGQTPQQQAKQEPQAKGSRLLPLLCGEIAWFFLVCVFLLNKTASQSGRQTAYVLPTRRTVCV